MVRGAVHIQRFCFVLVSGLILHLAFISVAVADLKSALERIQPLKVSGRYFSALDVLVQLEQDYPDSSRLKLEQALVYIQLEQFDSALALLSDVLDDPDLPDAVRVQVQLLYLSTRRKQTSFDSDRWRVRGQLGYISGLDLGQASAELGYANSHRIATYNARGFPWHLDRLYSIRTNFYQDSAGQTPEWRLDLAGGLRQSIRNLTIESQLGLVLLPSDPMIYAQLGTAYQVTSTVQLAYRLTGQWLAFDFDQWQHRFSLHWAGESDWESRLMFAVEDNATAGNDYRFWQASVTRPGEVPLTLRLARTDFGSSSTTETNLSADWTVAPHWLVVPELGYWHTNNWQGWRLALGVEWTP